MKINTNIHACYNVFDSEELLEESIKCIRDFVSSITVIYQKKSHYGESCSEQLEQIVNDLKTKKLIDNLVCYTGKLNQAAENELNMNKFGYSTAIKQKCDYHMKMDCDEFYFEEDIKKILNIIEEYPVDIVTSYMRTYYKSSSYRLKNIEEYVVPVLFKVNENKNFMFMDPKPLLADPGRRMPYESCFCLSKDHPVMHHFSFIRKDIRKKFNNSVAKPSIQQHIEKMVLNYNNWKPGDKAFLFGNDVELEYTDKFKKEIKF